MSTRTRAEQRVPHCRLQARGTSTSGPLSVPAGRRMRWAFAPVAVALALRPTRFGTLPSRCNTASNRGSRLWRISSPSWTSRRRAWSQRSTERNNKQILSEVRRRRQAGQTAVIVALTFVVLIAFAGLAIDGGHVYLVHRRAQNATDAAALAAAKQLANSNSFLSGPPTAFNDPAVKAAHDLAYANGFPTNFDGACTTGNGSTFTDRWPRREEPPPAQEAPTRGSRAPIRSCDAEEQHVRPSGPVPAPAP